MGNEAGGSKVNGGGPYRESGRIAPPRPTVRRQLRYPKPTVPDTTPYGILIFAGVCFLGLMGVSGYAMWKGGHEAGYTVGHEDGYEQGTHFGLGLARSTNCK